MEVKNLFNNTAYNEIAERINKLTPATERQWGRMTVSQMLAHCNAAMKVPLSQKPLKGYFFFSLIGPLFKSRLYDKKMWRHGLPTAPDFVIKDERDFLTEKKELLRLIHRFHHSPAEAGNFPHPVFGKFTKEQWGMSMWKHLDHHLRQFGV